MSQTLDPMPISLSISPATVARLSLKTRAIEPTIRQRYAAELRDAEIDVVVVHYLYGVTTAMLPEAAPREQIGFLRHLASHVLSPDAISVALHVVPPAEVTTFRRMLASAEAIGRRDAETIRADTERGPVTLIEPRISTQGDRPA